MFHELEIRNHCHLDWAKMAVSDRDISYVRPEGPDCASVYDCDDCRMFTVKMPYDELVARLNGQEVPKKPEVVDVDAWGVYSGSKLVDAFACKSYAEMFIKNATGSVKDWKLVHLKGVNKLG